MTSINGEKFLPLYFTLSCHASSKDPIASIDNIMFEVKIMGIIMEVKVII